MTLRGSNGRLTRDGERQLVVTAETTGTALPYALTTVTASGRQDAVGALVPVTWNVTMFPSAVDPRVDVDAWRRGAEARSVPTTVPALRVKYGHEGPPGLAPALKDHFGTMATAEITVPAGNWRIRTTSDDGIRVWLDDAVVIDDWTWHPPKTHEYEFRVVEPRKIRIHVEHFELDGYAVLSLDLEWGQSLNSE